MYNNDSVNGYDYLSADLERQVATATPHQLVLIMFNGLMDELVRAKSHITAKRYEQKATSINRCIDILNALSSALNMEQGGDLAVSLASLYDYAVRCLYEASHQLSVEKITEVERLLGEIEAGWREMAV
ncbi:flagellar export chaperone FliS [Rosenbergiella australiborealis]|uniref:Flagellar secretion chaperone FliS n=1 Tax=Rosenbergiella australiborealis TaxID=1544696 RepID=A0ABS5T5E9_9GAMM|nr:flagellar export chaperone FliS [Rosenbergiella australiborealis]MBT0727579.1 flagellar export chaperone FliS [Rosenbergiella australiborealis]